MTFDPFPGGVFATDATGLPAVPGAYILLLTVPKARTVAIGGRTAALSAGRYLYCGSARGPGGIRSRVGRHMRRDKAVRWHVDQLTATQGVLAAWAFPGGNECGLAVALSGLPQPIPGFGSSDCPRCVSHLFAWPTAGDGADLSRLGISCPSRRAAPPGGSAKIATAPGQGSQV